MRKLYAGNVQKPKYRRSDAMEMTKIREPQRIASRTNANTVEIVSGEEPCSEIRVRVKKTIVAQMRTLVGRRTTANAARHRDARSDQRLLRTGVGLGFSFVVCAALTSSQGQ